MNRRTYRRWSSHPRCAEEEAVGLQTLARKISTAAGSRCRRRSRSVLIMGRSTTRSPAMESLHTTHLRGAAGDEPARCFPACRPVVHRAGNYGVPGAPERACASGTMVRREFCEWVVGEGAGWRRRSVLRDFEGLRLRWKQRERRGSGREVGATRRFPSASAFAQSSRGHRHQRIWITEAPGRRYGSQRRQGREEGGYAGGYVRRR